MKWTNWSASVGNRGKKNKDANKAPLHDCSSSTRHQNSVIPESAAPDWLGAVYLAWPVWFFFLSWSIAFCASWIGSRSRLNGSSWQKMLATNFIIDLRHRRVIRRSSAGTVKFQFYLRSSQPHMTLHVLQKIEFVPGLVYFELPMKGYRRSGDG